MEKKALEKDNSLEEIHLLEKFIYTCKNFINSCSRLIKTYSDVINEQDPLVKTVLSNKLELSRIVNDIEKHNLIRMEEENEELKKMISKLKKMMSMNRSK
jgi:Mg2+ and Co2+ transporter CorA